MIDVKTEDKIATVTMRHGKANALDIALCEGLADCFDKLRASDARAVVLTGQGHIFSAPLPGNGILRAETKRPKRL